VTDDKAGFWTTLPGILTGVAGLIGAIAGLLTLLFQYHIIGDKPVPQEPQEKTLLSRLDKLKQTTDPCHDNSWYAYVLDFSSLGDITRDYVLYIQQNPHADKGDVVLSSLKDMLEVIRTRNEAGTKYYDTSKKHSREFPDKFGHILDSIETNKRTGLSMDDERLFEAAIQGWLSEAGITSSTASYSITDMAAWCKFH
jgi:hypothetical protein